MTKDKKILVYVDNKLTDTYSFEDYDEYACEQLVGCSMMVGRRNDVTQKCICAFTQDNFIAYAELCKILNHYLTTGMLVEKSEKIKVAKLMAKKLFSAKRICPKRIKAISTKKFF